MKHVDTTYRAGGPYPCATIQLAEATGNDFSALNRKLRNRRVGYYMSLVDSREDVSDHTMISIRLAGRRSGTLKIFIDLLTLRDRHIARILKRL